jgi:hypothetical protein
MTGWDWWIVVGGALQAGGALVSVVGIVWSSRRKRSYQTRPQVIEAGPAMMSVTAVPPGVVAGATQSIEERVDALEDGLARLRDDLDERARELRAEAREAANEAAGRALPARAIGRAGEPLLLDVCNWVTAG